MPLLSTRFIILFLIVLYLALCGLKMAQKTLTFAKSNDEMSTERFYHPKQTLKYIKVFPVETE